MAYEQIIPTLSSVAACISAIAAFVAVWRMISQERSSYRPELISLGCDLRIIKEIDFWGMDSFKWISESDSEQETSEAHLGSVHSIELINVGFGTAIKAKVKWDYPIRSLAETANNLARSAGSNTRYQLSRHTPPTLSIVSETVNNGKPVFFEPDEPKHIDYIVPVTMGQSCLRLNIPYEYIQLVSACVIFESKSDSSSCLNRRHPNLTIEFYYTDIGGNRFRKKAFIKLKVLSIHSTGYVGAKLEVGSFS